MVILGGLGSIPGAVARRAGDLLHQLLPDPGRAQHAAAHVRAELRPDRSQHRHLRLPAGDRDGPAAAGPVAGASDANSSCRATSRPSRPSCSEPSSGAVTGRHERDGRRAAARQRRDHAGRGRRQGVRRADRRRRRLAGDPGALDRVGDRPQRRRQDDAVQHADRPLQADVWADPVRRTGTSARSRPDKITEARGRPDLPEHPPVRRDDRDRERDDRPPSRGCARGCSASIFRPPHGCAARSARPRRGPASCSTTSGSRTASADRYAERALLRRPAPCRDRASARLRAEAAAARRADRGNEPAGVRRSSRTSCRRCATTSASRSC